MLSLDSISALIVAAAVLIVVYVIMFAIVFGAFVYLTRRRLPHLRLGLTRFRLRLRLWQLMTAIVVLGLFFELVILASISFRACRRAEDHARDRWTMDFLVSSTSGGLSDSWITKYYRESGRYHQRMSEKYYDIARHPWRSVSPDPPEPTLQEAFDREMEKIQRAQPLLSATVAALSALRSAEDFAYGVYDKAATLAGMVLAPPSTQVSR